jgi:hypothetical protein
MIKWFKELLFVVRNYRQSQSWLENELATTNKVIRERTDIHADIRYKSENQIIVVGRYRDRDYVQTYSVNGGDFKALIEQLRDMQKYGHIGRIDAPPQMRAVFDNELRY